MNCCGCDACVDICPKKCIEMKPDALGFMYPETNKEKCINCGLCEKVCPSVHGITHGHVRTTIFAGVNKDKNTLFNSSSGGAFSSIYSYFLGQGDLVYGVRYGENFSVQYDWADSLEGCEQFRKSKYILSNTNHCFSKIEEQLKNGKRVLFSGTPCHCSALRNYLEIKKIPLNNIFIIDIICHGAPSQQIFDSYVRESNEMKNVKISTYKFRNKIPYYGSVNSRTAEISYSNEKTVVVDITTDPFLRGYYERLFYRDSCGECRYASPDRISDITIGDAWHIEKQYPEWDSNAGVSLILMNTERARSIGKSIFKDMELKETTLDWALENNNQLKEPTTMSDKRDLFFECYPKDGFYDAVNKCYKISALRKIKNIVKGIIYGIKK